MYNQLVKALNIPTFKSTKTREKPSMVLKDILQNLLQKTNEYENSSDEYTKYIFANNSIVARKKTM